MIAGTRDSVFYTESSAAVGKSSEEYHYHNIVIFLTIQKFLYCTVPYRTDNTMKLVEIT